ncbi:MAG: DUF2325 domain-containing protein [Candidatus Omnitrophica bacterium]|nr:DUF2325 domain-containing protein [Candidatus Omnitrophota bacterium]
MKPGKKPYLKPQIKQVDLVPPEVVLANCKSASGTNKSPARCRSSSACTSKTVGS